MTSQRKLAQLKVQAEASDRNYRRSRMMARANGSKLTWELKEGPAGFCLHSIRNRPDVGLVRVAWTERYGLLIRVAGVDFTTAELFVSELAVEARVEQCVQRMLARSKRRPPNKSRRTVSPVGRLFS